MQLNRNGFAMIEVLVSVVVLAVAALGYAALQLRGLSANSSALWRSKATVFAYEAADRMRANLPGVTAGQYNALITPANSPPDCSANTCTPAQMAVYDFAQWRKMINDPLATTPPALPGGSGVICLTSPSQVNKGTAAAPACDGVGTQFAIKVFWTEHGTETRFVTVVRP
ncbi:type IV pilus modification protein PilV [Sphaerotilus montanus]|uniref:type IV pilus modification protein PilV n=1 Tax=Sphaerotilus montanus TaxID=522889 RepID=UPI003FA1FF9D